MNDNLMRNENGTDNLDDVIDTAGDSIDYDIHVANTGNITLTDITLTDTLIADGLRLKDMDSDGITDGDLDDDGSFEFSAGAAAIVGVKDLLDFNNNLELA